LLSFGAQSFVFQLLSKNIKKTQNSNFVCCFVGGKMEKNEMGGACGAYGAGERGAQGSSGET